MRARVLRILFIIIIIVICPRSARKGFSLGIRVSSGDNDICISSARAYHDVLLSIDLPSGTDFVFYTFFLSAQRTPGSGKNPACLPFLNTGLLNPTTADRLFGPSRGQEIK